jgi:hypothetical protein
MTHTHYIPFVAAASTELYSASEGGREGGREDVTVKWSAVE